MNSTGEAKNQALAETAKPAQAEDKSGAESLLGGRYLLGDVIGQGAACSVYDAEDSVLGRDVAVKLFHPEVAGDDDAGRVLSEVGVLTGLDHPNIVPIFDAGTDTNGQLSRTYVVMELVRGTDLHRVLQRARLAGKLEPNSEETAALGAGVADALAYIHGQGIVHRDVKPANILIHHDDGRLGTSRPRLTDFGVARLVDETHKTRSGQPTGTATYFSPEQAKGLAVSGASDIYSLGLILLECLTGEVAFPGPAVAAAAARIHRDPHIPAELGGEWSVLLAAMTERDPASRPAADYVAAVLHAGPDPKTASLARPVEDDDAPATSPTPVVTASQMDLPEDEDALPPAPKVGRRSLPGTFALVVGIAAIIAVALVVAVFLILGVGAEPSPVDYPAVPGELGDELENLQEGVAP